MLLPLFSSDFSTNGLNAGPKKRLFLELSTRITLPHTSPSPYPPFLVAQLPGHPRHWLPVLNLDVCSSGQNRHGPGCPGSTEAPGGQWASPRLFQAYWEVCSVNSLFSPRSHRTLRDRCVEALRRYRFPCLTPRLSHPSVSLSAQGQGRQSNRRQDGAQILQAQSMYLK